MKLDGWTASRIGAAALTREAIGAWKMKALRDLVRYVKERSPFYARLFSGIEPEFLESIKELPFTDVHDITAESPAFLCVPRGDIARVATFRTSGTSGAARRFFSTDTDLENTMDFFMHGMMHVPGARTLICMSGGAPGSVGTLLAEALRRCGRTGVVGGFIENAEKTLEDIRTLRADSLVGAPAQILALARSPGAAEISLSGILLSGDYASESLVHALSETFSCPVFRHFGMAETGYGAAVECEYRQGMHIREADLWLEVVNAENGEIPDGEWGELAVTTLTRRGMPLIRFKTGDLARFLPDRRNPCSCGSLLRRLEVRGRVGNTLNLPNGNVHLSTLNDVLDIFPWMSGFEITVESVKGEGSAGESALTLRIDAHLACFAHPLPDDWETRVQKSLETIPPLRSALSKSLLRLVCRRAESGFPTGAKRVIRRIRRSG